MSGVTARPRHHSPVRRVAQNMDAARTPSTRLHEHFLWLVNDAIARDLPNDAVSRLADEYAESALLLLADDGVAAAPAA